MEKEKDPVNTFMIMEHGQLQRESIITDGVEELKFYNKDGEKIPMPEGGGC